VYRRLVRVKLFRSIEFPEDEEMVSGHHTVLDDAPSWAKHLVSQMAACRQSSR
jgi:hypothetical protein